MGVKVTTVQWFLSSDAFDAREKSFHTEGIKATIHLHLQRPVSECQSWEELISICGYKKPIGHDSVPYVLGTTGYTLFKAPSTANVVTYWNKRMFHGVIVQIGDAKQLADTVVQYPGTLDNLSWVSLENCMVAEY